MIKRIPGYSLKDTIKVKIHSRIYCDMNNDLKNTVFLFGSARSGTTWIANVINYRNEYRFMFEPFHSLANDLCTHFEYRQYIRPTNQAESYILSASKILSGEVKNMWVDRLNKKFICSKRLIKEVRGNLLAKWIHAQFPTVRMVFLLRHPCAVANSRLIENYATHVNDFFSQVYLVKDFLSPFIKEAKKTKDVFEKHIFLWCIENYIPLKQFNDGEIHIAFYEHFCIHPEKAVRHLFSYLKQKFDSRIFYHIKKPSFETHKYSAVISNSSLIDKWRDRITDDQIMRAVEILSYFGLDKVYSTEPFPICDHPFISSEASPQTDELM